MDTLQEKKRGPAPNYENPPNMGARRLGEWLERHGVAQRELARRLRCSAQQVNHLTRGRRSPGRRLADKLWTVAGIPQGAWDEVG
jgi:transcriptional regulator with XRE-family HTH domain